MTDSALLNDLSLMKAHFTEGLKIADSLEKKLTPNTSATRKGLSDSQIAKLLAKKNKNRH